MCSVVMSRRPDADWPLVIAANRDEMSDRPWRAPGRHWPDRPNVVAGLDELAGGSWMGVNDEGVVAAILNRRGTLGPADGKRSRGELVLDALDFADAADAADALSHLDTRAYRPFNLLLADNRDAFVLCHRGDNNVRRPVVSVVSEGVHMLTAFDLDQTIDPRIARHLPLFEEVPRPDPGSAPADPNAWEAWETLLGSRISDDGAETGAMNFRLSNGFGTVASSLLALPRPGLSAPLSDDGRPIRPIWRFCSGRPDEGGWSDVDLS